MSTAQKELSELADLEFTPYHPGSPVPEEEGLSIILDQLGGGWRIDENKRLVKEFRFPDVRQALAFADRVGEFSESVKHHPELTVGWGFARVSVWTHAIDGLCESDFIFAAKVDALE
ncbi:MAG: 4a-hydroxytetrahydrobiopterin dehydratase [Elusimicrobia bacterium]|nr:4a-hydroxytetrahydrobiopterin dehydratase [Elusimicrobiota bacterium]